MKLTIGILILFLQSGLAQTQVWGEDAFDISKQTFSRQAVGDDIRSTEGNLPHLAMGGSWETVLNVINLDETTPSKTKIEFFDQSGNRMSVSFRQAGTSNIVTSNTILVTLPPRGTMDLASVPSSTLKIGWARFEYISKYSDPSFGGKSAIQLVFRETVPGQPQKEAIVLPDWGLDDNIVAQFNNTGGFVSSVALCNGNIYSNHALVVTIADENGNIVATKYESLGIQQQMAFETTNRWPETRNMRGTISIKTSSYGLGSLILSFNPTGSLTSSQFYAR